MEDTDSSEDVAHTKEFLDKDKERTRYDHRDEGSDKTHEPSYFGGHLVDDADQDDAGDGERDIGKYKWVCQLLDEATCVDELVDDEEGNQCDHGTDDDREQRSHDIFDDIGKC